MQNLGLLSVLKLKSLLVKIESCFKIILKFCKIEKLESKWAF
jgi:hypothetical protein